MWGTDEHARLGSPIIGTVKHRANCAAQQKTVTVKVRGADWLWRSKYGPAQCRALRGERGVGSVRKIVKTTSD